MNIYKRQGLEDGLLHSCEHSGIIEFRLCRMLAMCKSGEKDSRCRNIRLHLNKRKEDHVIRSPVCKGLFRLANFQLKLRQSPCQCTNFRSIRMSACLCNARIYAHDLCQSIESSNCLFSIVASTERENSEIILTAAVATILKGDIAQHQPVCLTDYLNASASVIMVFLSTDFRTEHIGFQLE